MKGFIKTFFYFFVAAFLGYIILIILAGIFAPNDITKNLKYPRNGTGFLEARLADVDTSNNVDILVLGSSHAYRGYDPRVFKQYGVNLFNLGSSSQTFLQSEFLLNKYLDKIQTQKVIIDVYGGLLASDGLESSLDIIANARNISNNEILNLVWCQFDINVLNSFIYSLYDRKFGGDGLVSLTDGKNKYIDNGYVENYSSNVDSVIPDFKINVKDSQLESLENITATLKRKNIAYRLVQTPISKRKNLSMVNLAEMDTIFRNYGVYINFNDSLQLDNSFFLDDHHLNQKGAELYNRKLIQVLKNDGFITNQ